MTPLLLGISRPFSPEAPPRHRLHGPLPILWSTLHDEAATMANDRNLHSQAAPARVRRRGGHLRRLWPAIPEREIEIDGTERDAWRIVRHRGDVLGRVFAAPNGEFVYYRGPFNVTHETYTAPTLAGVVRAVRDLL